MNKSRLIIIGVITLGFGAFLLLVLPLTWQYFKARSLASELAQIRQDLAQPIQIHQALRRLTRAEANSRSGEIELSLSQLESSLASPAAILDPEFTLALNQAVELSQARYQIVSRLLIYEPAPDLLVSDLEPSELTARVNAATDAITKMQAQIKTLEPDISPASLNFIRVSNLFVETISEPTKLESSMIVQAKTDLDQAALQLVREPFTQTEFVGLFQEFNSQIETLLEQQTNLLNHPTLRIDDTQIDQGLE